MQPSVIWRITHGWNNLKNKSRRMILHIKEENFQDFVFKNI